jgi:hypothetical protein
VERRPPRLDLSIYPSCQGDGRDDLGQAYLRLLSSMQEEAA